MLLGKQRCILQISSLSLQIFTQLLGKGANLEKALAALAGAHSVVLTGCVIPAHCAQTLGTVWPPTPRGRGRGALVVHEVVSGGERVQGVWEAQNPRAVQVTLVVLVVHGDVERCVKLDLLLLSVFQGKQGESGQRAFPVRRSRGCSQIVLSESVEGAGVLPGVTRRRVEVGGDGCMRGWRAVIVDGALGGEQVLGLVLLVHVMRILHFYARQLRHLEEAGRLHLVPGAVGVAQRSEAWS